MAINELAKAIDAVEETPCVRHRCPKREQCANEEMACSAFVHYVRTGRAASPYLVIPARTSKRLKPVMGDEIIVSKEHLRAAFSQ